ncbi:MAG: hypothetical protein LBO65_05865 [Spirochaetaceae bacterium]|jgi:hypothetical protein|nr:hypothetical protein [Spirochaetaceae bacterium]
MNTHKSLLLASTLMGLLALKGFALDVTGTVPQLGDSSGSLPLPALQALQAALDTSFDNILKDIQAEIVDINPNPWKLIRGFADASVFASTGASQRAYEGYKYFAFTVGPTVGLRFPGSGLDSAGDIANIGGALKDDEDIEAGFNIQTITGQLSINTSAFLLENLYLGLRFGYFNFTGIDDLTVKTFQLGMVGNYQLVRGIDLIPDRVSWRGVGLGSGFIFQQTDIRYAYVLDTYEENFSVGADGGTLQVAPEVVFDMRANTFTVPMEINTAFQFFVFNINFGAGVDLAFGRNHMDLTMDGTIDVRGNNLYAAVPGSFTMDAGGSAVPTVVNPKLMMYLGFKFGPVVFDIPITYFFLTGHGLSAGITLGVVL